MKKDVYKKLKHYASHCLVVATVVVLAGATYAYAATDFFDDLVTNTVEPEVLSNDTAFSATPITIPTSTPKPSPTTSPKPVLLATPKPTTESDPIVSCRVSAECGSQALSIRKSECESIVCCPTEPNKYEVLSADECNSKRDDYKKRLERESAERTKAYEDAKKAYEAQMQQLNNLIESQARIQGENSEDIEKLRAEYEVQRTQLLEECRRNARDMYAQPVIGSQVGTSNAYVVGESAELRNKLNAALQRCLNAYGG